MSFDGQIRLPRNDEWEFAARGNASGKYSFDPGSNNKAICTYANGADRAARILYWSNTQCDDQMAHKAANVGSYRANPFGLHDVHGNVWEWVAGCRPEAGERCTARGGSWLSGPAGLELGSRHAFPADTRRRTVGFRVLRELK